MPKLSAVLAISTDQKPPRPARHAFNRLPAPALSHSCRFSARRSLPLKPTAKTLHQQPAKRFQNARSAKRPRPPRRRLGPARPQHLLRGHAERRARGRGALGATLFPRKLLPARLRPDRAAAALRGRRARGGTLLRPRHLWLVLRPNCAAAADDGALFKQLRPRWVRPGLHATATLLLPPEEGRARDVYCRERHVLEGN